MIKFWLFAVLILVTAAAADGQVWSVNADDLKILEGRKWTGNLVYVDYSSNKKTQINSNLTVSPKPGSPNVWIFAYEYPDEPKANGSSEVALGDGGKTLSGGSVIETRRITRGDMLLVVTTKPGTDNDRNVLFRYSYLISRNSFAIKKEVQIDGSTEWFTRNEFSWSRPNH